MTKQLKGLAALVTAVCFWAACTNQTQTASSISADISNDSLLKRGEYLVTIMGCEDCHSPKEMGPQGPQPIAGHRLGGFIANTVLPPADTTAGKRGWVWMSMDLTATKGPWGTSYASNISSNTTGIGTWTENQFANAMRKGLYKGLEGNRMLLPPMPWPNFKNLSDTDLKAIYTFLKNTPPVKNTVPEPQRPV